MFLSEIKLFLLVIIFLFIPGITFLHIVARKVNFTLFILLSAASGLFIWTLLSTIGFIFAIPLKTIVVVWVVIAISCGIGNLVIYLTKKSVLIGNVNTNKSFFIFLIFTVIITIVVYWKGSFQDGDAWYHVAQAVNYLNQPRMVSESAYFSGSPAGTLYDFNAWHTFIAAIALLGEFEPSFVWINLSVIILPLIILSLFSFVNEVFRNRDFSVTTVILVTLAYFLELKFAFIGYSIIPSVVCNAFLMPIFFNIYFSKSITHPQRVLLAILFTVLFIHVFYYLVIVGYLFVYYFVSRLFKLISKQEFKRNFIRGLEYFSLGIPLLIAIYLYCLRDYKETFPGTELPLIYVFHDWPIFSLTYDKLPFYLSIMVSIFLIVKFESWRRNPAYIFIVSNILIVPLMVFNPLLLYFVEKLVPLNLIGRLTSPFFLYIPLIWLFWEKVLKKIRINYFVMSGFIVLVLFVGGGGYLFLPDHVKERLQSYDKYEEPMGFHDFALQFHRSIPPESVIIADPYTSYHLPVFADVDIVSMIAHSTPPLDLKARIRDTNRFFNPLRSIEEKKSIIEKYNIDYSVINRSILPWVEMSGADTLFCSNLYPEYYTPGDNVYALEINELTADPEPRLPEFISINENLSVFPNPDHIENTEILWKHAGMIFLKIKEPLDKLYFHSKGGAHQVFYYCVMDAKHEILDEKVYINDFSFRHIYHIDKIDSNSYVIFSGNGISSLIIQTL